MRIQTNGAALTVREWQSRRELSEHVKNSVSLVEIGNSADAPVRFFSVAFSDESRILPGVTVAISSEFRSMDPQLYILSLSGLVLVGADEAIHGIRDHAEHRTFEITLPGLFRFVIPNEVESKMLVFSEIGVSCVRLDGSLVWEFTRDVITEIQMLGDVRLALRFMDSSPIVLDLLTGKESQA